MSQSTLVNEVNYILPVESRSCEDFTIGDTVECAWHCHRNSRSLLRQSSASFVICEQRQRFGDTRFGYSSKILAKYISSRLDTIQSLSLWMVYPYIDAWHLSLMPTSWCAVHDMRAWANFDEAVSLPDGIVANAKHTWLGYTQSSTFRYMIVFKPTSVSVRLPWALMNI